MKHNIRNNSYELERVKQEFYEEMESVPAYRWEDELEVMPDSKEVEWRDSIFYHFGTYGVDF